MFPKDDPQVIIYAAVKASKDASSLPKAVKKILSHTAKRLNIESNVKTDVKEYKAVKMPNVTNNLIDSAKAKLSSNGLNMVVIGSGNKVVKQYPKTNTKVSSYDKIFLITNDINITLPDIKDYSRKDAETVCDLLELTCNFNGTGYVTSYTEEVKDNKKIVTIELQDKYNN